MNRRRLCILGATGSVGRSTLDLVARAPDRFDVLAVVGHRDAIGLAAAARQVGARRAVIADDACRPALTEALTGSGVEVASGDAAVMDAAGGGADWTMAAIVGSAGLAPTMQALAGGRTVALANKEALVSAGDVMTAAARASGATLLPVDSEHNALFQCFDHARPERVRRMTLTASGGPFRALSRDQMRAVTPREAVAHPNWSMGAKISVDSATLMNKGLELIEAFHLFPLRADQLDAVIHPQSVIHGLVDYVDGSVLAQLGPADMRVPIAHALAWPDRMATPAQPLDLVALGRLDFEAIDEARFPAFALARQALEKGGAAPAILNAANEIAVAAFLDGRLAFLDIATISGETLARFDPPPPASLEAVLAIDTEAREIARSKLKRFAA